MDEWLLERLFSSKEQPSPRFAFLGTINWIKALSLFVDEQFNFKNLQNFYSTVSRKKVNTKYDTIAYDNLLMSLHNVAAIEEILNIQNPYNVCRSAIVSWYYCMYFASSAMIAACSNSSQETHSETGIIFQNDLVKNNLLVMPFSLNIPVIVKKDSDLMINNLRKENTFDLNNYPIDKDQAYGSLVSYLNGTAVYERWRCEEKIKMSSNYKKEKFTSFRTRAAQEIRDNIFCKHPVNFLIQSFRFRGKSNYRDSIYLSYGDNNQDKIIEFIFNMLLVSKAFYKMAGVYVNKRVEKGTWDLFKSDLRNNLRIKIDLDELHV